MKSNKKPTIVLDMDGVIATGTPETVYSEEAGWAYENCTVVEGALESVKMMSEKYNIILSTARLEQDAEKTMKWLDDNGFLPYLAEVHVGVKPSAVAYIDDRGYHFQNWKYTLRTFMEGLK